MLGSWLMAISSSCPCLKRFCMYIIQKAQWQIKSCIFVVGYETVAFNYVIEDLLKCEKSKRKKSHVETVCISVTYSAIEEARVLSFKGRNGLQRLIPQYRFVTFFPSSRIMLVYTVERFFLGFLNNAVNIFACHLTITCTCRSSIPEELCLHNTNQKWQAMIFFKTDCGDQEARSNFTASTCG